MLPLLLALACSTTDDRPELGKWRKTRSARPSIAADLAAIGYLDGYQPFTDQAGVSLYDEDRAWQGHTVMSFGHAPEAQVQDMEGNVLHRWCLPYKTSFPDEWERLARGDASLGANHWRRVEAFSDGTLLAIHEGRGIVRMTADSEVLWTIDNRAHHDIEPLGDGRVAILTRSPEPIRELHPTLNVQSDYIDVIDLATGVRSERIGVLRALLKSRWNEPALGPNKQHGDVLHTNAVRYIPDPSKTVLPLGSDPVYLVSMREPNALAAIDATTHEMVWFWRDDFRKQHDARILADGSLGLFDNRGVWPASRVLVYGEDLARTYTLDQSDAMPLATHALGAFRELGNGNLLVTESEYGRAFEVVRATGDVVWQYHVPFRAGEDDEFVAVLFLADRVDPLLTAGWMRGTATPKPCVGRL
jgi:hypothetical protein